MFVFTPACYAAADMLPRRHAFFFAASFALRCWFDNVRHAACLLRSIDSHAATLSAADIRILFLCL